MGQRIQVSILEGKNDSYIILATIIQLALYMSSSPVGIQS